ncbi:exo-alpha-sialidase, partial [bacterium]|nr:exo-alpha-sialidase [bacterium]
RGSGGAYHLVYESSGEVYYQKSTDGGSMWSGYKRLSSGNGSNKYPCLAERSGSLFAVWQRYTGSTHVVYHRRYASGAWGSTQTLDSNAGANAPLPVIASPAANELMMVYRSGGNLKWRRSTDNGSSWSTAATISGTALNSPTVAPAKTAWGANTTALAYATNVIPNASNILLHYYNSGWSAAYNLSSGLPGNLSQHANPSVAASGDLAYWHPHTAWDAYDSQYASRVILHKAG